jgi:hypothetical protein
MDHLPTPFTLYPSRKKTALFLFGSAVFVAGGIFLIIKGETIGWFCTIFFGLGLAILAVQLVPGCAHLTVDDDGIEICMLFRRSRIAWSDIGGFGTFSIRNHGIAVRKMVGINFSEAYASARSGRAVAKALSGFDGSLPDTYGLKAEDLAVLLSHCRMTVEERSRAGR